MPRLESQLFASRPADSLLLQDPSNEVYQKAVEMTKKVWPEFAPCHHVTRVCASPAPANDLLTKILRCLHAQHNFQQFTLHAARAKRPIKIVQARGRTDGLCSAAHGVLAVQHSIT